MSKLKKISGRPRDQLSKKAILDATVFLIRKKGYEGLAIEQIAERAQVGKTTIYRWWENKASLAIEAFFNSTVDELKFSYCSSAKEDFRSQIQSLAKLFRSPYGKVLGALLTGSKTDPKLAKAISQKWLLPRKKWGFERINKAIKEGECLPGINPNLALEAMYSPLYSNFFLNIKAASDVEINEYLDFVLPIIFK